MLAWTATPTNRPAVAVRALERLDPDRGWMRDWPSYWTVLADAHHFLGQHEQELAAARRGRLKFPMDLGCLLAEVKALAASNRVDELERALAELSYASPLVKGTFQSFDETIRELRRHGHAVLAERLADRLTAELEARNGPPMIRLRTLWAVGRWERAAPLLQELAVKSPQSVPLLEMRALLAASRGNRFEAERLAGEALAAGMIVPYHADLLASIHALFGEYAEALEKLRATAADRRAPRRLHLLLPDTMHEYAPFREFASRRYDDPEVFPARRRR